MGCVSFQDKSVRMKQRRKDNSIGESPEQVNINADKSSNKKRNIQQPSTTENRSRANLKQPQKEEREPKDKAINKQIKTQQRHYEKDSQQQILERYNIRVQKSSKEVPNIKTYNYGALLHNNPDSVTSS